MKCWRGVDQDGDVLDILVQPRRDQRADKRFFRKLLKGRRSARPGVGIRLRRRALSEEFRILRRDTSGWCDRFP